MDKKVNAKKHIKELVERFDENISQYKRPDYDEANTRTDFIDPLFENLGWDVANKQGYAEQYREVVREAKVTIAGKQKAPDYSFRIGGIRKFFVEAKKPSVDLKHEVSPAYQLKRYAYTAKLPLSILTDFEEFSVYDTRIKPTLKDSASCARIFYCGYKDYLKNFDFIYDTFSKDGLLKGSFDRYVESTKNKRGTSEVDKEFLKLIDRWREGLAKNIALRNKSLSLYELNFAVQKVIDRIIFLRIAEDRQIEDYGKLQNLLNGVNTYKRLVEIFLHSDKKYNSGLFDFKKDEITSSLSVDDKIIKEILKSVYYPESPYEFSVLDVEILGNIYEQFLGKTIRLTPAHQVKVEEKPEVKKAGGVYYTPKYIVDYIVKNTVGEIIKDKTPKQIEKLNLIDPACGSGSFLLGAYQELLNYHLDWYSKDTNCKKALKKGQIVEIGKDSFQLTITEKQRILLNNIFGVDIDTQAVEVSKLSLLLKLLEGETEESTGRLFKYTQMKLLPDLSKNIKCGNSLIGPDFYKQMSLLNDDEARRINAFDWEDAFPDIFENGGFDVVIGNPPWVDIKGLEKTYVDYYFEKYKTTSNRINVYAIFMERALQLLATSGYFSFILPNSILFQSSYEKLRKIILDNFTIRNIGRMPDNVFKGIKAETVILVMTKTELKKSIKNEIVIFDRKTILSLFDRSAAIQVKSIDQRLWYKQKFLAFNIFLSDEEFKLLEKIEDKKTQLIDICDFTLGITPYDKYKGHTEKQIKEKIFHSNYQINNQYKKLLVGGDISRYFIKWNGKQWLKYGTWLGAPREKRFFTEERILIRQIVSGVPLRIFATVTSEEYCNTQSIFNLLPRQKAEEDIRYLLGILNSKLINFYHTNRYLDKSKMLFQKILIQNAKLFPIRTIDFSNPSEKVMHDKLVAMVEKMLELQKKSHFVRLESDKKMYQTQIDVLDNQIDSLVYELYGLREKEIKIVEGS